MSKSCTSSFTKSTDRDDSKSRSFTDKSLTDKGCHFEKKCANVEYKLCEKNRARVPVLLVTKLFVPKFSKCVEIVKDDESCAKKLCTKVEGWVLCSSNKQVISGLLTEKIYGPHFKKSCPKVKKHKKH